MYVSRSARSQHREVVVDVVLEPDVVPCRRPEHVDDDRGHGLVVLLRRLFRAFDDRSDVDASCASDQVADAGREGKT